LEYRMSAVQDALDQLNDATNTVAVKLDADIALITQLQEQLAATDPSAAADLATALAGISAATTTLRGLAADPEQPVPPSDPIVGDNGDTTAGEPGTDPSSSDSGDGSGDSTF
jgi:hypothetical protein